VILPDADISLIRRVVYNSLGICDLPLENIPKINFMYFSQAIRRVGLSGAEAKLSGKKMSQSQASIDWVESSSSQA
jgi:hypothetical protein